MELWTTFYTTWPIIIPLLSYSSDYTIYFQLSWTLSTIFATQAWPETWDWSGREWASNCHIIIIIIIITLIKLRKMMKMMIMTMINCVIVCNMGLQSQTTPRNPHLPYLNSKQCFCILICIVSCQLYNTLEYSMLYHIVSYHCLLTKYR